MVFYVWDGYLRSKTLWLQVQSGPVHGVRYNLVEYQAQRVPQRPLAVAGVYCQPLPTLVRTHKKCILVSEALSVAYVL